MDLGGSLQDIVRMGGCQGEYVIQNIARQIFTGVDFLHSLRLIHRDLKPSNALISSEGKHSFYCIFLVIPIFDNNSTFFHFLHFFSFFSRMLNFLFLYFFQPK